MSGANKNSDTYHNAGQTLGHNLQRHSDDLKNRRVAHHTTVVADNEQDRVDRPANHKQREQLAVQAANLLLLLAQQLKWHKNMKEMRGILFN